MRTALLVLILTLAGCGKTPAPLSSQLSSSKLLASCPAGAYDPSDIDDLIAMINALPRPMSAECFLKALKRPLYVNATSSVMSVQPAQGAKNPRIFIFKGNLIIALVPAGEGSSVLEFSELKNDVRSIKGEIDLPVGKTLNGAEPFAKINSGNRTTCQGCHTSEQAEFKIGGEQVYSSKALQPSTNMDVPLSSLSYEHYLCNFRKDFSKRCDFYRALFDGGDVLPKSFPADMPTLLNAF